MALSLLLASPDPGKEQNGQKATMTRKAMWHVLACAHLRDCPTLGDPMVCSQNHACPSSAFALGRAAENLMVHT